MDTQTDKAYTCQHCLLWLADAVATQVKLKLIPETNACDPVDDLICYIPDCNAIFFPGCLLIS